MLGGKGREMRTSLAKHLGYLVPLLALGALAGRAHADTFTHYEETDQAVTYAGSWFANDSEAHSGGSSALAMDPTATVTLTFTGTGVAWNGYRDEWSGNASVYLDGWFMGRVDTYSSPSITQVTLWSVSHLANRSHTLTIEALGTRNPSSGGNWVWVDSFDSWQGAAGTDPLPPSVRRTESSSSAIKYLGEWYDNVNIVDSGGSARLAIAVGASASFRFYGRGVRWISYRDQWSGIAQVYLDGALVSNPDNYSLPALAQTPVWSTRNLNRGYHTIVVMSTHAKDAFALQRWIWVDAFDVIP
jgi:hypothetical protein